MAAVVVVDDVGRSRVEALVDGDVAGFTAYLDHPGLRVLTHTEVDPAYGGQGIGGRRARWALARARADGVRVVPCAR